MTIDYKFTDISDCEGSQVVRAVLDGHNLLAVCISESTECIYECMWMDDNDHLIVLYIFNSDEFEIPKMVRFGNRCDVWEVKNRF
jgi:hypothetical protein